jgi:hypothetical protein
MRVAPLFSVRRNTLGCSALHFPNQLARKKQPCVDGDSLRRHARPRREYLRGPGVPISAAFGNVSIHRYFIEFR